MEWVRNAFQSWNSSAGLTFKWNLFSNERYQLQLLISNFKLFGNFDCWLQCRKSDHKFGFRSSTNQTSAKCSRDPFKNSINFDNRDPDTVCNSDWAWTLPIGDEPSSWGNVERQKWKSQEKSNGGVWRIFVLRSDLNGWGAWPSCLEHPPLTHCYVV